VPTPYDSAGSAHWRNKADNCITIFRNENSVDVHVQKIRVKEIGRVGVAQFKYKVSTGEYFPMKGAY
jgi:twinkle protein